MQSHGGFHEDIEICVFWGAMTAQQACLPSESRLMFVIVALVRSVTVAALSEWIRGTPPQFALMRSDHCAKVAWAKPASVVIKAHRMRMSWS